MNKQNTTIVAIGLIALSFIAHAQSRKLNTVIYQVFRDGAPYAQQQFANSLEGEASLTGAVKEIGLPTITCSQNQRVLSNTFRKRGEQTSILITDKQVKVQVGFFDFKDENLELPAPTNPCQPSAETVQIVYNGEFIAERDGTAKQEITRDMGNGYSMVMTIIKGND